MTGDDNAKVMSTYDTCILIIKKQTLLPFLLTVLLLLIPKKNMQMQNLKKNH